MRKNKMLTTAVDSYRCRCLSLPIILLLTAASLAQAQTSHLGAEYYNRGNDRYKSGDLVGAIADYDAALIFKPRWALAYKMRQRQVSQRRSRWLHHRLHQSHRDRSSPGSGLLQPRQGPEG